MCGIAGFFNAVVDDHIVQNALAKLKHRGPDANGYYHKDRNGLIHTRLSIIDLSSLGAQPYYFKDFVLVFNGELYNYKEVREVLRREGYSFDSNSDTEVLIKAFDRWREKCVDHFIGMFAFAIYEASAQKMWLFRDRLGVKPLYYYADHSSVYFASELKALLVFGIPRTIDQDAVSEYFRFGFIGGSKSIFEGVKKLNPGYYAVLTSEAITTTCYWDSRNIDSDNNGRDENSWIDELEELMHSAFNYRMVADVPVGVFLSGGIDSSLLTAILQKGHGNIHTFTIGFDEQDFDESIYANNIAAALKTQHQQKTLALAEARDLFFHFYDIYDEPFADTSGIPTSSVTSLAKDAGMKVVLSADGGDELFGGYAHYQEAMSLYTRMRTMPRAVRSGIRSALRTGFPASIRSRFVNFNLEHKVYAFEELLDAKDPDIFFEAFIANQASDEIAQITKRVTPKKTPTGANTHPWQQMMDWDRHHFLPDDLLVKVDRATMFHGLECREPFLDHRLVEFSTRLPLDLKIRDGKGKYILRQLLKRYFPESFFERPKKGFSIPVFAWFGKELDRLFEQYLSASNLRTVPFLNEIEILKEVSKYRVYRRQHKPYNIEKMWRLLSFMMWWEKYGQSKP